MIPTYTAKARQRINQGILWVEQFRNQLIAPPPESQLVLDPGWPPPCRGYLLQNIWGGGSGMMQCVERRADLFSFIVILNGVNVANSASETGYQDITFRLKVVGVATDDSLVDLYTTTLLHGESYPSLVQTALILGAQDVGLPVGRTNVQVTLGNPLAISGLIDRSDQTEIDKTTDPPEVYIGVWHCTFSGPITRQYKAITCTVENINTHVLADVVSYPTSDVLTDRIIPVHDLDERTADYPWKVGSKAKCIYFPDVGYGIIGSSFHNMTP